MGSPTIRIPPSTTTFSKASDKSLSTSKFMLDFSIPNQQNPLYRTKPCRNYPLGHCRYGDSCGYLHSNPAMARTPVPIPVPVPLMCHSSTNVYGYPSPNYLSNEYLPSPALSTCSLHHHPSFSATENAIIKTTQTQTQQSSSSSTYPPSPCDSTSTVDELTMMTSISSMQTVEMAGVGPMSPITPEGTDRDRQLPPPPPGTPTSPDTPTFTSHTTPMAIQVPTPLSAPFVQANAPSYPRRGSGSVVTRLTTPSTTSEESSTRSRRRSRSHSAVAATQGVNHYRTKPCKFFSTTGECIKGTRCNFIHDLSSTSFKTVETNSTTMHARNRSSSTCTSNRSGSVVSESRVKHELPHKPQDATDENSKKEFYPITWRVIGGGVMMGGKREVCREFMAGRCTEGVDCKDAHPDVYDDIPYPSLSPMSIHPPPICYPFYDTLAFSPLSPFYLTMPNSASSFQVPPSSPPTSAASSETSEQVHHVQKLKDVKTVKAKKILTVTTPALHHHHHPETELYSVHRVYDGNTLREVNIPEPVSEEREVDGKVVDHHQQQEGEFGGLFSARSIVRPMSTPPTPVSGLGPVRVVKLFAAESP